MSDGREVEIGRLLIGESRVMRELRAEILRFGPTRLPILVQGPTGSGKELVARALHAASRRQGALVAFNVCALNEGMFEDALFGHVRGAFTGASRDASGYLAEANGGTLFLDEISGLGLQSQAKLLRALETGAFRPVGGTRDRVSDFRLVSASNEDLLHMSSQNRFRVDLLHRIGGCVFELPSLSARCEDIPLLARHFVCEATGGAIEVSGTALARLQDSTWPGNVRQLRHAMDRLIVISGGVGIDVRHVESTLRVKDDGGGGCSSDALLRLRLVATLRTHEWNTVLVAQAMKVHRATIYRWMNRLGISAPPAALTRETDKPAAKLRLS
jgi:sigma-54-specific transcriptional regulator